MTTVFKWPDSGIRKDGAKDKGVEDKQKKQIKNLQPTTDSDDQRHQPCLPAAVHEEEVVAGIPSQSIGEGSRFQRLPEDLEEKIGKRVFENEDDFEAALEALKITDEPIVLGEDGKAYYYTPGDAHNAATGHVVCTFYYWTKGVKGYCQENTNVVLREPLPAAPPPKKKRWPSTRLPDVALWGRSKCELKHNGEIASPSRVDPAEAQPVVHPHVVLQISAFNDEDYEVDAINDLATRAVAAQGEPPRLCVLIKQRKADTASGVQAGFDIYYLPAGTFFEDAVAHTRGARHDVYNLRGPDVRVTITEQDLGGIKLTWRQLIADFLLGGTKDFELSMAELYRLMFD
jgi:hypothetical protein